MRSNREKNKDGEESSGEGEKKDIVSEETEERGAGNVGSRSSFRMCLFCFTPRENIMIQSDGRKTALALLNWEVGIIIIHVLMFVCLYA